MYSEEDFLLISGIQHFVFCKRQWALIHIENQWQENILTYEGRELHTKADNPSIKEKRGDLVVERALPVHSAFLGMTGICDVVEFHRNADGIRISGHRGKYLPVVVEYKHGHAKADLSDTLQLLLESLCLGEMLGTDLKSGDLFYFETRRRVTIAFTDELIQQTLATIQEMHQYWQRKHTPIVKTGPWCKRCSLANICLPKLMSKRSAAEYINERLDDEETS